MISYDDDDDDVFLAIILVFDRIKKMNEAHKIVFVRCLSRVLLKSTKI